MSPVAEKYLAANAHRWVGALRELVRIPSSFEHEHAIVARLESFLREVGCLEMHRVPHAAGVLSRLPGALPPFSAVPDRHSIVAVVRGTGGGRSLALNAHLDVASEGDPAAWSRPPFSGDFDSATGCVFGRGAMDDKAGVVVLLAVLDLLLQTPGKLRGDLIFHFVLEDEITGNGTHLCLDAGFGADAAFIVDGTRLDRAIDEHAGQLEFSVGLTGRPASVSVAHMGINAAEVAARLSLELHDFIHAQNAVRPEKWRIFPSPYRCSLQAMRATSDTFTLPESAVVRFFVTFCPPDSLATMRAKITDFISAFGGRYRVPRLCPDWRGFAAEPVATTAPPEIRARLAGASVRIGPSTGTSDLRHFVNAGIPCLLYGPGGGQNPHRPDESYPAADLAKMTRFYFETACGWCGLSD